MKKSARRVVDLLKLGTSEKKLQAKRKLLFFLVVFSGFLSYGQEDIYQKYDIYRNPVRVFINRFSLTATTGYISTSYRHDLENLIFYQNGTDQFILSNATDISGNFIGYSNWLNGPTAGLPQSVENPFGVPFDYLPNPVNNPLLRNQEFFINTDTASLGFRGVSRGIPITLQVHYPIQKFRVGFGFTYEKQFLRELEPTSFTSVVRPYQPNFSSTHYRRLFLMGGYTFYEFWNYQFAAELQVGRVRSGKQFTGAVNRSIYANLGVSIENIWSEYFRVIVRPSIDFKRYTVNIPDGSSVRHRYPSFHLQFGVSINIPEIPKSPMMSDHTQLKHIYTNPATGEKMEVRGQPIWKRQNPKVGENHRKLWRYKWRNRKKLNPY